MPIDTSLRTHSMPHLPSGGDTTATAGPSQTPAGAPGGRKSDAVLSNLPKSPRARAKDDDSETSRLFKGPHSAHIDLRDMPSLMPSASTHSRDASVLAVSANSGGELHNLSEVDLEAEHTPAHHQALQIQHPPPQSGSTWRDTLAYVQQKAHAASQAISDTASHVAHTVTDGVQRGAQQAWNGTKRVAGATATATRFVGNHALDGARSGLSGTQVFGVDRQFAGAAVGHLIHQFAAVGIPTFAREMMAETMFAALRTLPPSHVAVMEVAVGAMTLASHRVRQFREQRNPEAAARGFHNLNAEQWEALPREEKDHRMAEQRRYSDAVTTLATASVMTNVALAFSGEHIGHPEMAARVLTSDVKVAAYAAARDAIQASFRMVGTEGETNGGVSGAHMDAAANFYGMANIVANYAGGAAAPAEFSNAQLTLAGLKLPEGAEAMSRADALHVMVKSSAIKATVNTLLEAADWTSVTQQEANEAGTRQKFDPALKGNREDYMRVLDQSIARTAAIDSNISLGNALGIVAEKTGMPAAWASALGNIAPGVAAGMSYKVIGGTWQAEGAVRAEEDKRRAQADPEAARPHPAA